MLSASGRIGKTFNCLAGEKISPESLNHSAKLLCHFIAVGFKSAVRFYYLLRTAYGGKIVGQNFGISPTRPPSFNLLRIEEELSAVHLRLGSTSKTNPMRNLSPNTTGRGRSSMSTRRITTARMTMVRTSSTGPTSRAFHHSLGLFRVNSL